MMAHYQIVPRGGKYFLEAVDNGGGRKAIETFATEDAAVRRLRALQEPYEPLPRREDRYPPKSNR
jgi:hypothetical protein